MTAEQITAFVDDLKKSLLENHARGVDITLNVKHDQEPVYSERFPGVPADYVWQGCTFKIKIGKPAREQMVKDERKRQKFFPGPKSDVITNAQ